VIAIGPAVDLAEPTIAQAVGAAVDHGVLVVVPAAKSAAATAATPAAGKGVLRVAGVGRDGQRAADYAAGGVDIVAPGIDVAGLNLGASSPYAVSGTAYAVAAVAGAAALARAAHPQLDPAQLVNLLTSTADASAATLPDPGTGWGMIDPRAAVGAQVPGQQRHDQAPTGGRGRYGAVLAVVLIAIVLMVAAVLGWARRRPNGDAASAGPTRSRSSSDREHTPSGNRR
jgi:membrane-anchored mycosin MYCP